MENLYIKFREKLEDGTILNPNSPSLEECIEEAERLGYEKPMYQEAMTGKGLLILDTNRCYKTMCVEEELTLTGHKEYTIPNPNTIKVDGVEYREVYVSDMSVEKALSNKTKRILITTLPLKCYNPYICVTHQDEDDFKNGENFGVSRYRYIAEIPKEDTPKKMTVSEIEEVLGYLVEIVK